MVATTKISATTAATAAAIAGILLEPEAGVSSSICTDRLYCGLLPGSLATMY